jgi:hypothetical protein
VSSAAFVDKFADGYPIELHSFAHLLYVFHGLAGGFAVERFLDEAETGDLLAMAGDDDFLPVLSEI